MEQNIISLNNDYGPPEIDPEEIEIYEDTLLGSGAFGNVYAGRCRAQDVAVKVLVKQEMTEAELETFRHEIRLMSKINHPNIVLYMGACTTVPGQLQIVTERMEYDLSSLLSDNEKKLTLLQRLRLAKDCALGMSWLHGSQNPIIHHDLKPSNCLIDTNLRAKISDFGLSIIKQRGSFVHSDFPKGTAVYMAPEVYEGEEYDEKCDVYSFGIIIWETYTRQEPFSDSRQALSVEAFCEAVCEDMRPEIPEDCPLSLKTLISNCWDPQPDYRPSFSEIVNRLDDIIIEEAILDPTGRQFWRRQFSNKDKVSWNQFIREFSKFMGFERYEHDKELMTMVQCLKALFVTHDDTQSVNLEHFGKMLDFFGPVRRNGSKNHFLPNLKSIISQSWFHGDISSTESAIRLFDKTPGTFLVRFSSTERGYFTISQREEDNPNGLRHVRIKHPPLKDEYSIKDTIYTSLIDLINSEASSLNLKEPCIDSYFSLLLSRTISDNGYVETK